MAAGLIGTAAEYLNFIQEVDDNNVVFKLFTGVSFLLCVLCAVLVGSADFFGKPIECHHGPSIESAVFDAYCWINGATHIPSSFGTENIGCYAADVSSIH